MEVGAALEIISGDLTRVEALMAEVSARGKSLLAESAPYLTKAGGKRVRPALLLLASRLGRGPSESVYRLAAALELTHMATLYHDDVIDEADTRRGVPSANEKWGNKVAILAGDFLFARASGLAADVSGPIARMLSDAIARVVEGQVLELDANFDPGRTHEHYFQTIEGKTASLLSVCTEVGATLGDCPQEVASAMGLFGLNFGFAFQVADDLLDLTATLDELGKPPGTDIRDGVYTLPVLLALQEDPSIAGMLVRGIEDVDPVRSAVFATGAYQASMEVAGGYVDKALESLAKVPEGEVRSALENLTKIIIDRIPVLK